MYIEQVAEIEVSYKPNNKHKPVIKRSQDAYDVFRGFFSGDTISLQESFAAMYLNRANKVIGVFMASKGGMTGTIADPRLILAVALKTAACSVMLCHNHPSGNLKPSRQDEELTTKIKEAGRYMDIKVIDHLILAEESFYSFADEGMM